LCCPRQDSATVRSAQLQIVEQEDCRGIGSFKVNFPGKFARAAFSAARRPARSHTRERIIRHIHGIMKADSIAIVDCHAHFLDAHLHTYPIFQQRSSGFEALVGEPYGQISLINGFATFFADFCNSGSTSKRFLKLLIGSNRLADLKHVDIHGHTTISTLMIDSGEKSRVARKSKCCGRTSYHAKSC
jgi:hypothetical protein